MDIKKTKLIENSFNLIVLPNPEKFISSFYDNLFTDFPDVKNLFKNAEMGMQGIKLLDSLKYVVQHLCKPEELSDYLEKLGKRHVGYSVTKNHYPMVRKTLLKTLSECAGKEWTEELKSVWVEAWDLIEKHMIKGAGK